MDHPAPTPPRPTYTAAIVITVSLFFLWGMANNLNDILIAQFRKAFVLSDFGTSFVQQVFYLGYFLFSIPAAMLMGARGYRAAIVTGLVLYGCGALLFYPAAENAAYWLFLVALFVIASGLAFLETSANPLMTELGPPSSAARRINWAQAANPLGAITGIWVGRTFILSDIRHDDAALAAMGAAQRLSYYQTEIRAVAPPYLAIGLVVLCFAVAAAMVRFPTDGPATRAGQDEEAGMAMGMTGEIGGIGAAFRRPRLLAAAGAQLLYVGAQVGLWSYTIRYAQAQIAGMGERAAADALLASLLLFALGRLAGTAAMARVRPATLLAAFAGLSLVSVSIAALHGGQPGLYALVGTSFFMSIQFPTIFALGLEKLGPLRRAGAALLVMAIIGGAIVTAIMGWLSDRVGIAHAMLVPAFAFAAILVFAVRVRQDAL